MWDYNNLEIEPEDKKFLKLFFRTEQKAVEHDQGINLEQGTDDGFSTHCYQKEVSVSSIFWGTNFLGYQSRAPGSGPLLVYLVSG